MICCYQVTKLFCSRCCFTSASSARSPSHLGSQAYLTISIFWEVSVDAVLPGCHFCGTFRIRVVRNVCGCWHFCISEIICELPLTVPEGLANGRARLDCYSFFCFGFLVDRASFLVLHRQFALLLDLKMYLMSPAVASKRTRIGRTIPGQQEVRNCPFCRDSSSFVWSDVAFDDRWPTQSFSVFFAEFSK